MPPVETALHAAIEAIDPNDIVGQRVTLTVNSPDGEARTFNGFVRRFVAGPRRRQ